MKKDLYLSLSFFIVGIALAVDTTKKSESAVVYLAPVLAFFVSILFFIFWFKSRNYILEREALIKTFEKENGDSEKTFFAKIESDRVENLEISMRMLIKEGRKPLNETQLEAWERIKKYVPASNPLKKKLNKIHFTCDFEELEGFKTQFVN